MVARGFLSPVADGEPRAVSCAILARPRSANTGKRPRFPTTSWGSVLCHPTDPAGDRAGSVTPWTIWGGRTGLARGC